MIMLDTTHRQEHAMFDLIGFVLILLGILGLVGVIALGTVVSIILIVIGVACFAYARGAFARR